MAHIYSATKTVPSTANVGDHLYLVFDLDDDPYNQNELIIRGGTDTLLTDIDTEASVSITASEDNYGSEDPLTDRYYTDISNLFNGLKIENVWAVMAAHAVAINDEALDYQILSQNSNSVVASILNSVVGSNYASLFPNAPSSANDWFGQSNTLSTVVVPVDGYDWEEKRYQLGTELDDTLIGSDASKNYVLDGGAGNDILTGNDEDDIFYGGAGNDRLYGRAGDDLFVSSQGNDRIYGEVGNDLLSYKDESSYVAIDYSASDRGRAYKANNERDSFYTIEQIEGSQFDDKFSILGSATPEKVFGLAGDDYFFIEADIVESVFLDGGLGQDTVYLDGLNISDFSLTVSGDTATYTNIAHPLLTLEFKDIEDVRFSSNDVAYAGSIVNQSGGLILGQSNYAGWTSYFSESDVSESGNYSASSNRKALYSNATLEANLSSASIYWDFDKYDPQDNPTVNLDANVGGVATIADRITITAPTQGGTGYTEFSFSFDVESSGYQGYMSHYFDIVNLAETGAAGSIQTQLFGQWFDISAIKNFSNAMQFPSNGSIGTVDSTHNFRFLGDEVTFDFFLGSVLSSGLPTRNSGEVHSSYGKIEADIVLASGSTVQSQSGVFGTQNFMDDLQFWDGTANDDVFQGSGFDEVLNGQSGNDTIYAGEGNDTLFGGTGDDQLYGEAGDNLLIGGIGNDTHYAGIGIDTFLFHDGFNDDTINTFQQGTDILNLAQIGSVSSLSDLTIADSGTDKLITVGSEGTIRLTNFAGIALTASDFVFALTGTGGSDSINGSASLDVISGLDGQDFLYGLEGADTINGGAGDDRLYGNEGNDTLYGEAGSDKLYGHDGNDTLYGDAGIDALYGDAGEDILYGGADKDYLYGGNDDDTLHGGAGNDQLRGEDGHDTIQGDDGSDTIYGGNGDDVIIGGNGRDYLNGNAGADTFYLDLDEVDRVRDFDQSEGDTINIADLLTGYDAENDDINDFVDIVIRSNTRTDIRVNEDGQGNDLQYVGIIYGDLTGETVDSLVASRALIAA